MPKWGPNPPWKNGNKNKSMPKSAPHPFPRPSTIPALKPARNINQPTSTRPADPGFADDRNAIERNIRNGITSDGTGVGP